MVTIEQNFGTDEEVKEALASLGFEPAVEVPPASTEVPKPETSEQPGKPGGKTAAEPDGKIAPGTETGEPKPQEVPPGESEEERKKSKGGFQKKIETLTAKTERLREELEDERGDKTRLQERLAEAERQLAEHQVSKPEADKKDEGPVRPKRPSLPELSEFEYDAEKFAAAMKKYRTEEAKYDEELMAYVEAVADKKAESKIAADQERQRSEHVEAKRIEAENAFVERRIADPANEELQETVALLPKDYKGFLEFEKEAEAARVYIKFKSKTPAALMLHFAKDHLENDGKETERFLAMDPIDHVFELREIEKKILADREAAKAPTPTKEKEPKPAEARRETPPAKPQQAKVPDAPIEPVGGRVSTSDPGNLQDQLAAAAERGDPREVRRIRDLMRVAEARRAGRIA